MYLQELGTSKAHLLQVKDEVKLYQVAPRNIAYALQEPFKKELERLKEYQILPPLGINEMAK